MFRTLFWKIWMLGISCSVFAICLVLLGLTNYYLQAEEKAILQRNFLLAQVITHEVESGYLKGMWPYKTLKMVSDDENVLLLWIAKPNGEIFWADGPEMFSQIVQDPFLGSEELRERNSYFQGERIKLIAHPIKIELKEKPWTLFLGISFGQLKETQKRTIFLGMCLFVLAAVVISFVSFYFSKKITDPLKLLTRDLEIIGKGDLDHRVKIKTGDELEGLGISFNKMAEELKISRAVCEEYRETLEIKVAARTKELKELAGRLEEKVKERTKELEARVGELERFHQLTVGRELKMIELKKALRGSQEKHEKLEQKKLKGRTSH